MHPLYTHFSTYMVTLKFGEEYGLYIIGITFICVLIHMVIHQSYTTDFSHITSCTHVTHTFQLIWSRTKLGRNMIYIYKYYFYMRINTYADKSIIYYQFFTFHVMHPQHISIISNPICHSIHV